MLRAVLTRANVQGLRSPDKQLEGTRITDLSPLRRFGQASPCSTHRFVVLSTAIIDLDNHVEASSQCHMVLFITIGSYFRRRRRLTLLIKISKLPLDFVNRKCYCVQFHRILISLT